MKHDLLLIQTTQTLVRHRPANKLSNTVATIRETNGTEQITHQQKLDS
jgi:hypothetical protein